LIGMAMDGLASFEPAFVDELAIILRFALDYVQRSEKPAATSLLRDEAGGAVYLRLSTRVLDQPLRLQNPLIVEDVLQGAYWLRKPGPNAEAVIIYTGAVAQEAMEATGLLAEDRRDVGLMAVTSADRLHAGWTAAQRLRDNEGPSEPSHIERLLAELPAHCALITVLDGHPTALSWIGSVFGHRLRALGVERFGQTGTIADLYRCHGLDAQSIVAAAQGIAPGRPVRHLLRTREPARGAA
jgi:pyruvate dehydrogenase E1 component